MCVIIRDWNKHNVDNEKKEKLEIIQEISFRQTAVPIVGVIFTVKAALNWILLSIN